MSPTKIKTNTIIKPYLILFLCTVSGYMLLSYLLDITHLDWDSGVGLIANFWLPLIAPLILVIAFLHKRIAILQTGRAYIFYISLAYSALSLALFPARKFILSAPYQLHNVQKIEEINIEKPEHFYSIKDYELQNEFGLMMPEEEGVGTKIKLINYSVSPFKSEDGYTNFKLWYAVKYEKTVKALGVSATEYNILKQSFIDSVKEEDNKIAPAKNCYFEVLPDGLDRDYFISTLYSVYNFNEQPVVIRRVCQPFSYRYLPYLLKLLAFTIIGTGIFIFTILATKLNLTNWRRYNAPDNYWMYEEPEYKVRQKSALQFFIPQYSSLVITPVLILVNLLYFIILILAGNSILYLNTAEMQAYGGNSLSSILSGQVWRLLLSSFLHSGFAHLMGNMLSLAVVGSILEPYLGRKRFLTAYILCAVMGSFNGLIWRLYAVSAGASVPIAGMYGLLLALLLSGKIDKRDRNIISIVVIISIVELILVFFSRNIDNAGHIGGFITGVLAGFTFVFISTMSGDRKTVRTRLSD